MIDQQARRRGVEPEYSNARINGEAKLRIPDGHRLTQPLADLRDTALDGNAIVALDHERERVLADLAEMPRGPGVETEPFERGKTQDRGVQHLLGDAGRDDLRDIRDAVDVEHGHGKRLSCKEASVTASFRRRMNPRRSSCGRWRSPVWSVASSEASDDRLVGSTTTARSGPWAVARTSYGRPASWKRASTVDLWKCYGVRAG